MPFLIRKFRRLLARCPVTYHRPLAEGSGTVWNLSASGFRFSGDMALQTQTTLNTFNAEFRRKNPRTRIPETAFPGPCVLTENENKIVDSILAQLNKNRDSHRISH